MIQVIDDRFPEIADSAYVHPAAVVIGDVELGEGANVWPGAVLRGDNKKIIVGKNTSVQDGCVLHTGKYKLTIADHVLVGHRAALHSCDIGAKCIIGVGAIVMDAADIGERCIVAAGTLIPPGKVIPPGSVVMGNPYKIVRQTTQEDIDYIVHHCRQYAELANTYKRTGDIL